MTEKAKSITFQQIHGKNNSNRKTGSKFLPYDEQLTPAAAPHQFEPPPSGCSFVRAPPLTLLATVAVSGCCLAL
jgi:hypothetical protein